MRNLFAALALILAASTADAKPRRAARPESQWMRDCITERTGPVGGVTLTEARRICRAEQPQDDIDAAKAAVVAARHRLRIVKAKARAKAAILACEQAVTDACVDAATPERPGHCELDDLKAEVAACYTAE